MTKTIGSDITSFKEDFFKGLSFRETVYGIAALGAGAGGMLFLHYYLGMDINLAITLCVPVIALIGFWGFYRPYGMVFSEYIGRMVRLKRQRPYSYETKRYQEMEESDDERDG